MKKLRFIFLHLFVIYILINRLIDWICKSHRGFTEALCRKAINMPTVLKTGAYVKTNDPSMRFKLLFLQLLTVTPDQISLPVFPLINYHSRSTSLLINSPV